MKKYFFLIKVFVIFTFFVPLYSSVPSVSTGLPTNISNNAADCEGNIYDAGGLMCDLRGICWNTTGTPTIADSKDEYSGNFGVGSFPGSLTGLSPKTLYFVRAYAHNSDGYGYGNEESFWTLANEPTLQSGHLKIRSVTYSTAYLKWKRGDGEKCIVVMKENSNFTQFTLIDGWSHIANDNFQFAQTDPYEQGRIVYIGTGNTLTVTGLQPNTTYYVYVVEFNGSENVEQYDNTVNYLTGAGAYIRWFTTPEGLP